MGGTACAGGLIAGGAPIADIAGRAFLFFGDQVFVRQIVVWRDGFGVIAGGLECQGLQFIVADVGFDNSGTRRGSGEADAGHVHEEELAVYVRWN